MTTQRFLVLGAGGLVGTELVRLLGERALPYAARSRSECDITAADSVAAAIDESSANVVINCGAYNAVDRAETDSEEAMRVNCGGARTVAEAAARSSALVIHYSTDFVFAGDKGSPYCEEDAAAPASVYARTKLAADEAVRAANPRHLVVRVGNIYGRAGKNFGSTLLDRLRSGQRIVADAERRVQPTWGRSIAVQTLALASSNAPPGLYHSMCHGNTTWVEFAREMARQAGLEPSLVEGAPTASFKAAAIRPAAAALENRALARLGPDADRMPHWSEALRDYLESRRQ